MGQAHIQKNLFNAEFGFMEFLNAKNKRAGYPGHESAHKGAAQELFLYMRLPHYFVAVIVLMRRHSLIMTGHSV